MSLWPNWIRRLTTNQKIGGSSPSRDTFLFFCNPVLRDRCCIYLAVWTLADIAQLGERQTEDLKVPGSIPGVGITFFVLLFQARVCGWLPAGGLQAWHLGRVVKAID